MHSIPKIQASRQYVRDLSAAVRAAKPNIFGATPDGTIMTQPCNPILL
jgi:hypothetical protein